MMHDKIAAAHPETRFIVQSAPVLYLADFTNRTSSTRSVEITDFHQSSPNGAGLMDSVILRNDSQLDIEFSVFDDYVYMDAGGVNLEHCECSMYLAHTQEVKWVAFFELKDCEEGNITNYEVKARTQILHVVEDFRYRGIVTSERLYGIISFPKKKTAFNDTITFDKIMRKRLKKETGILYYGTNEVLIVNNETLMPVL